MEDSEGVRVRNEDGELRLPRFVNSLDYSLDLIKLRKVYELVHRNKRFSFKENGQEYTQYVINVTFKYSYKQFNQCIKYDARLRESFVYYVRAGYTLNMLEFHDRLAFKDDQLVGVCVDAPVSTPVAPERLGKVFSYDESSGSYQINHGANQTLKTRKDLREDLYANGFLCDGKHYVRFKRSSGSSRVGKCLFIEESLAGRMRIWEKCGVPLRKGQKVDLAAWEAYISLTLSSIIDTIEIRPENILLIDDYESTFQDTMMAIGCENGWLTAEPKTTTISNSIWDGQSLLDVSMFDKYRDKGMLLLRTRFFKSACFNTNLQRFFKDNGITEVSQLKGKTRAKSIGDIKLVITPASLKYLKFGDFDEWLDRLEPEFGIIKYDKPTHFFDGDLVQTHYQLLNTLHMNREEVRELLAPSRAYYQQLDTDPVVFRRHVGCGGAWPSDDPNTNLCFDMSAMNELSYYLLGHNKDFIYTKIYHDWKIKILRSFKDNIRKGHVLVHGTYATLFGNPYEMLQATIGAFDGTSLLGTGHIYCPMFKDGEDLVGSRSPHVAAGNILLTVNKKERLLDKYFNLTPQIVCINSIEENILERLSGADMDSDTMLLTSDPMIVQKAKEHYDDFLVPTKLIESKKKKRHYTDESKADLDHVTAENRIGEIVNLSQELNSLLWDKLNRGASFEDVEGIYEDIAKLDVLSNIEIDRAKREYEVDTVQEMKKMRQAYTLRDAQGRRVKPFFFAHISRKKGYYNAESNHYKHHMTTMDYLQDEVIKWRSRKTSATSYLPFGHIFDCKYYSDSRVRPEQAKHVFEVVRSTQKQISGLWLKYREEDDGHIRKGILQEIDGIMKNRVDYLVHANYTRSTIHWMMRHIEDPENVDIRFSFLKLMLGHPSTNFRGYIKESEEVVPVLKRNKHGAKLLYGIPFDVQDTCKKDTVLDQKSSQTNQESLNHAVF